MSEIKINIEKLEEEINKLRDLKIECESLDITEVALVGGGQSIRKINEVNKKYLVLKATYINWISNSIAFFENMKNSIISADEEVSSKLH